MAGSSPHREASKDLQEEAAPEDCEGPEANQDQPGRRAGGGGTPVSGECSARRPGLCPRVRFSRMCLKLEHR